MSEGWGSENFQEKNILRSLFDTQEQTACFYDIFGYSFWCFYANGPKTYQGLFRTQSNIKDGAFNELLIIFAQSSILDV